jgi:hypothetical protein
MSRINKIWIAVGLAVATLVAIGITIEIANHTVVPMVASGEQVTTAGRFALGTGLLSSLGLSGGTIAAFVIAFLHNATSGLTGGKKLAADQAVTLGSIVTYVTLYLLAGELEKPALRQAAKALNDAQFDSWFPPVIGG